MDSCRDLHRVNGNVEPLPFSEDSEKGLLCCLIWEPGRVLALCAQKLSADVLYIPAHRLIFDGVLEWNKPDRRVDFIWLKQTLRDRNQLDEIGGIEGLN